MPQVPMLPPEQMAAQGQGAPTNPINFLIAAATAAKNGQLATPQRSMPSGPSEAIPSLAKRPRKNIRIIK